ncbi:hypothetical protein Patl1_06215 [Pistacia atlantica]|uniref:Uncharacterized protein n=1 Tax=Pistacia atlantica TaxID=434234 RepID=A0ACC1BT57_9ROSI|nr:hypothetical protein Patl1_06215 [Pistacia atlantica]
MPRYDDRYGGTRLYVGRLASRTRSRDLEDIFGRYGRIRDVDMKRDFAFVEFSDPRDADDARYSLNGRDVDGSRIIVEFAKGGPRGPGGSREYLGRGPPPGSGRCFNCGIDGHWARDCKAGDWKNKCYRCGERGHIERNCQNSPKKLRYVCFFIMTSMPILSTLVHHTSVGNGIRSLMDDDLVDVAGVIHVHLLLAVVEAGAAVTAEAVVTAHYYLEVPSPKQKLTLPVRSRSPVKRERSIERVDRRTRSPRDSRSPKRRRHSPLPSRGRKRSPTPDERSPLERGSPSPRDRRQANGSEYSGSPRVKSRSPVDDADGPDDRSYRSPAEENGRSRSRSRSLTPIPRDDRSPIEDDDNHGSPRGSESN